MSKFNFGSFKKKLANPLNGDWWKPETTSEPVKLTSRSIDKLKQETKLEQTPEEKPLTIEEIQATIRLVKESQKES